jgi:Acyl-CoA dehydrogenase, C-terminal domain
VDFTLSDEQLAVREAAAAIAENCGRSGLAAKPRDAAWQDAGPGQPVTASRLWRAAGALTTTARYANKREQFGRAIATFQAVALHAGDAFIERMGVVADYPLRRYLLWAKQLELSLGPATWHLGRLADPAPLYSHTASRRRRLPGSPR